MSWPRFSHLIPGTGWFAVHADHPLEGLDLYAPIRSLVTLRPIAGFGLLEDLDDHDREPFIAIAGRDYNYGGVPSGFAAEDELEHFIGYLAPGTELEMFRGAIEDHYEQRGKQRQAA